MSQKVEDWELRKEMKKVGNAEKIKQNGQIS
jgi:hypothetical protein